MTTVTITCPLCGDRVPLPIARMSTGTVVGSNLIVDVTADRRPLRRHLDAHTN
jgi:hypothetical protein